MQYEIVPAADVPHRHLAEAALAIAGRDLGGFLGRPGIEWVRPFTGPRFGRRRVLEAPDHVLGVTDRSDPARIFLHADQPPRSVVETTLHEAFHVWRHERLGHFAEGYRAALAEQDERAAEEFATKHRPELESLLRGVPELAPPPAPATPSASVQVIDRELERQVFAAIAAERATDHGVIGERMRLAVHRRGVGAPKERFRATFRATADSALDARSFRGMASVFGIMIDAYPPTIIERGAFTKTLREDAGRVVILWQHNPDAPIGLPTMLRETEHGLEIEATIADTTLGRDAVKLVREGVVQGLSIGFDPVRWEMRGDVRHLHEVKLWEVSLVTWGANPLALVTGVGKPLTLDEWEGLLD